MTVVYDCYALNDDELKAAEKIMEDADVEQSLNFSSDIAQEALADLKEDLDYFLLSSEEKDKVKFESEKEKKEDLDINPFTALFGLGKKKAPKKKEDKGPLAPEDIRKDNFVEEMLREEAVEGVVEWLYLAFDIYKKAHRMASAPGDGFDKYLD